MNRLRLANFKYRENFSILLCSVCLIIMTSSFSMSESSNNVDLTIKAKDTRGEAIETWARSFPVLIKKVISTQDGGYLILGTDSFIPSVALKLNPIGEIEWQKAYGEGSPMTFDATQDGDYIIGESKGFYMSWLLKIDDEGNIDGDCPFIEESDATVSDLSLFQESGSIPYYWLNWFQGIAPTFSQAPSSHTSEFICSSCATQSCAELFDDVPTSNPFCPHIEALYNAGIVSGCSASPLLYCPAMNVTREQMAKYLVNAFGFVLY